MNFFGFFAARVTSLCIAEGICEQQWKKSSNWSVIEELLDIEPYSWTVVVCEVWDVVDFISLQSIFSKVNLVDSRLLSVKCVLGKWVETVKQLRSVSTYMHSWLGNRTLTRWHPLQTWGSLKEVSRQMVKGSLADTGYMNFQKASKGPLIGWLKQKQGGSEWSPVLEGGHR